LVARLADEDEGDQVAVASDRTAALAGPEAGDPLRIEAATVVAGPDRRAGLQDVLGRQGVGQEEGRESGGDEEA
jgi:hypothetical protein